MGTGRKCAHDGYALFEFIYFFLQFHTYVRVYAHVWIRANPLCVTKSMNYFYDARSYVTKSWEFKGYKNRQCTVIAIFLILITYISIS